MLRPQQQPFGGGKTAQPAADAPFNHPHVGSGPALQAGVGFVQLGAQPLARQFDHCRFFLPPRHRTAQHILFADTAIGMGHQLGFHAGLHQGPVLFLKQLRLKLLELPLGRAHDVARVAGPQEVQVLLADHPAIQHPNPLGLAIFLLHEFDHVFDGPDIGRVPGEDFVADRQPLGRHHQANVDLLAIGPMIP